jgi:hypothetical protein
MKCLVSAFDALDMEVIFFENAFEFKKSPHCVSSSAITHAILETGGRCGPICHNKGSQFGFVFQIGNGGLRWVLVDASKDH